MTSIPISGPNTKQPLGTVQEEKEFQSLLNDGKAILRGDPKELAEQHKQQLVAESNTGFSRCADAKAQLEDILSGRSDK